MPSPGSRQPLRACLLAIIALLGLALLPGAAAARTHRSSHSVKCSKLHTRHARAACLRRKAKAARKARAAAAARKAQAARRRPVAHRSGGSTAPSKATPSSGSAGADTGLHVGLIANSQGWGGGMGQRQDTAQTTGTRWLREEFDWNVFEPQPGVWDWSRYDMLMTDASQRGLEILPLVCATPSWAGASWNTIPSDPSGYATAVARVAARYGPGGSFWSAHPQLTPRPTGWIELWNEPYFDYFSQGGANPGLYARLVRAATTAGRAANPQTKYLLQVDAGGNNWSDNKTFLSGMYAAVPNLNDYYDAAAVHPYGDGNDPSIVGDRYGFQNLAAVRAYMVAQGAASKPMWITEVGWPTCPAGPSHQCVTEAQQAAYMKTVFDLSRTTYKSFVRAIFIYHYEDFKPGDPNDTQQWFGLTRTNGSHKPAFAVFSAEAAQSN